MMTSKAKENSVTGLVTSLIDYGEKDRLATLITPGGKLSICFKGIRRPNAKLNAFAAPYVFADFFLSGTTVTGGTLRDTYQGLKLDLYRASAAAIVAEAIGKCSEDGSGLQEEFPLTLIAMKTVETLATFPLVVSLWYLLKLMEIEGADTEEFPLPAGIRTLFRALSEHAPTELDAVDATEGDILLGLSYAAKIFQNALQIPLKSVLEAIKLMNYQNH